MQSAMPLPTLHLVLLLTSLVSSHVSASLKYTRVAYGEDVPTNEMPYFVTLVTNDFLYGPATCGGTIVAPGVVLTAAHCVVDDYRDPYLDAYVLLKNGTDTFTEVEVSEFAIPDAFYPAMQPYKDQYFGDIALLRINPNVTKYSIRLPTSEDDLDKAPILVGSGKGLTEGNKLSKQLEFVSVRKVGSVPDGSELVLEEDHFVAKDPQQNQDTCVGDSGGPLLIPSKHWNVSDADIVDNQSLLPSFDVQVGVVSYGEGTYKCGDNNTYGIYTDVMYWKDWINEQIKNDTKGWTAFTT